MIRLFPYWDMRGVSSSFPSWSLASAGAVSLPVLYSVVAIHIHGTLRNNVIGFCFTTDLWNSDFTRLLILVIIIGDIQQRHRLLSPKFPPLVKGEQILGEPALVYAPLPGAHDLRQHSHNALFSEI